jgi:hypothetical protein
VPIRAEGWPVSAPTTHAAQLQAQLPSLVKRTNVRYTAVLGEVAPFRHAVLTDTFDALSLAA